MLLYSGLLIGKINIGLVDDPATYRQEVIIITNDAPLGSVDNASNSGGIDWNC